MLDNKKVTLPTDCGTGYLELSNLHKSKLRTGIYQGNPLFTLYLCKNMFTLLKQGFSLGQFTLIVSECDSKYRKLQQGFFRFYMARSLAETPRIPLQ